MLTPAVLSFAHTAIFDNFRIFSHKIMLFSWVRYVSSFFSHPTTSLPDGKKA